MKIIISGTSGVGKSTTVKALKKYFEAQGKEVSVLGELVVGNPYFDLYFNDITNWGFLAQLDFLVQRFDQWVKMEQSYINDKNHIVIYDRHFLEDLIFSELKEVREAYSTNLQNAYKVVYYELLKKVEEFQEFEKPDFFIMLKASFDTVEQRQFVQRGRALEDKFDQKYWQDLYYRYYSKSFYRKIFVDYTKNFVDIDTDNSTPDEVVAKIIKYIKHRSGK